MGTGASKNKKKDMSLLTARSQLREETKNDSPSRLSFALMMGSRGGAFGKDPKNDEETSNSMIFNYVVLYNPRVCGTLTLKSR